MIRVNVGCGPAPTPDWINVDNSPSILIGRIPMLMRLLERTGFVNGGQVLAAKAARRYGVRRADARRLPFGAASVDVIYSSHMLEHLDREEAAAFLAECRRVLRPGGWLRLVVPDLKREVDAYLENRNADDLIENLRFGVPRAHGLARLSEAWVGHRMHRWMYDAESLVRVVDEAGFMNVQAVRPGHSNIPDTGALNLREREEESVYVEAQR